MASYASTVLLNDLLAYPQAQAGACSLFGGKERLEYAGSRLRLDSFAVVGYRNSDPGLAGVDAGRLRHAQCNHAIPFYGFNAIEYQVRKHLAQLSGDA